MDIIQFLILALATWRISSLLVRDDEHGPFNILNEIRWYAREWLPAGLVGSFDCLWCMSIWIGIVVTIFYITTPDYTTIFLLPFALSALAIMTERING